MVYLLTETPSSVQKKKRESAKNEMLHLQPITS